MAGFKINFTGVDPLSKIFNSFKSTLAQDVGNNLQQMGLRFQALAMKATPVDFGPLRASITTESQGMQTVVGTALEYATFVEYGTSKMEARHVEGTQSRILGTGPFTYAMEQFKAGVKNGAKEIAKDVENRFSMQKLRGFKMPKFF